ncbi:MAG: single-stranded-DNA-specific exonuclease RecJ [Kofleriaceae bacterium]|nr:single-stranded-DNA-specific exonuclease RecJ [Kofleriaceae bacterium]
MTFTLAPVDDAQARRLADRLGVHPAAARCLAVRGIDVDGAAGFLAPTLAGLRRPDGLAGFDVAVGRLVRAVVRGERIGVFGDYDVDGVTSAAVLTSMLRACGAATEVAVAERDAGYGFSPAAAAAFADQGCALIVTCDCGTSDLEALAVAAGRGVEVIVIDHHTVPAAGGRHPSVALVNPLRADSTFPFRGMASVGLAFYVATALRTALRGEAWFARSGRPEPDPRDLLDLVALGTVADLVPLRAENRILTSAGLARLATRTRPGLAALLDAAAVDRDRPIDTRTISWKLAPRLNAPGRLGASLPALELLLADAAQAPARAAVLEDANARRRLAQDHVWAEASAALAAGAPGDTDDLVFAAGRGWAPGVVGVVASRLVEQYGRPAFVIALGDDGVGRGSARTAAGVDLYAAMATAAPLLERFGGHAAAAGLTVRADQLDALRAALGAAVAGQLAAGSGPVAQRGPGQAAPADAEVHLGDVDERLAAELGRLAPFGQDNPAPRLLLRGLTVRAARKVGDGSHLKVDLGDGRGNQRGGIGFGLGARDLKLGDLVDVIATPTISTWQGQRRVELELADLAPAAP